jgi:hypothetical protein
MGLRKRQTLGGKKLHGTTPEVLGQEGSDTAFPLELKHYRRTVKFEKSNNFDSFKAEPVLGN